MRQLTESDFESTGRCGQNRRTPHHARQRARELDIPHRLRIHGIHRTAHRLVFHRPENDPRDIVHMNATHPLPPVTQTPSQAELKNRTHQTHRAARACHESNTKPHHAVSERLGRQRRSLPGLTHVRQKTTSRRSRFIDLPLTRVTVESNRRGVHQHANARMKTADHLTRRIQTAAQDYFLLRCRPQSQNRLAREVHHGIQARKIEPSSYLDSAKPGPRASRKPHHTMPRRLGHAAKSCPYITSCSDDSDFHVENKVRPPWLMRQQESVPPPRVPPARRIRLVTQ